MRKWETVKLNISKRTSKQENDESILKIVII